jgi:predicted RND superfamily exporter protein
VAQLYLLLEQEDDFTSLVQDNYGVARVSARVQMSNAEHLAAEIPSIEKKLRAEYGDDSLRVTATGFIKLMSDMESYLVASQTNSFLLAFAIIVLMLGMLLRSARLALFSMIPNFLPILCGIGFMSAVGIPLDPGTVMIGSIALGLVVDDTVHFMVRLRRRMHAGDGIDAAVANTVRVAGRPIVITSVVLIAGFLVLMMASFTPNFNFGLVTALVVALALVADLAVLPAALVLIRPRL